MAKRGASWRCDDIINEVIIFFFSLSHNWPFILQWGSTPLFGTVTAHAATLDRPVHPTHRFYYYRLQVACQSLALILLDLAG